MQAFHAPNGGLIGKTTRGSWTFDTTGVLGASGKPGHQEGRGFPAWLSVPSWRDLALGRHWHFFFAWVLVLNGLIYLLFGLFSGHFARATSPRPATMVGPRHVLKSIWDHVRLKHATGDEAKRYNILQKLAYIAVIFVLVPLEWC